MANSWTRSTQFTLNGTGDLEGYRITRRGSANDFILYKGNKEITVFDRVDTWDEAARVGSAYVRKILEGGDETLTDPNAKWRKDPASESQMSEIERLLKKLNKGDMSDLISKLKSKRSKS